MDFTHLIKRHSEDIIIYEKGTGFFDYDNGGKWTESPPISKVVQAAVFQMGIKELGSNLQYGEGGSYSIGDIKLYIQTKLIKGEKVTWKGQDYTVDEELDYSSHSKDLHIYLCKSGDVK